MVQAPRGLVFPLFAVADLLLRQPSAVLGTDLDFNERCQIVPSMQRGHLDDMFSSLVAHTTIRFTTTTLLNQAERPASRYLLGSHLLRFLEPEEFGVRFVHGNSWWRRWNWRQSR